ncbi:heme-binding protein [Anatilimnocola aggregata]|nr:heme-binding protein [Anatilimnocola aggregata]
MLLLFASLTGLLEVSLSDEPAIVEDSMNSQSAKLIADGFAKAKDQPAAERLQTFQAVAKVVQEKCAKNVLIAEQLQAATSGETLETALSASYDLLTFKMKKEADLPAGFPEPTPVGEIELKQYPAYRLARTASEKNSGFFKLFAHITLNRIEMTAPVEMTYRANDKQVLEQIDMAFIYGDTKLGKTGDKLGGVTVQDIPALTTVSIGLKGDNDRVKLSEVERRLERWLAQHATDHERAGNLRVLGYNSPQVSPDSRYYEVELPIKMK